MCLRHELCVDRHKQTMTDMETTKVLPSQLLHLLLLHGYISINSSSLREDVLHPSLLRWCVGVSKDVIAP